MTDPAAAAGTFALAPDLMVARMGYGAMRLSGPGIYGPPADRGEAVAVLRRAVDMGVNHIDTSDYYGPHVTNEIIREALHPYPDDLVLVTKVGARRTPDKGWPHALAPAEIRSAVHDNLRHLGLERMAVVNLRVGRADGPDDSSLAEPLGALVELQSEGLVGHIGVSNVRAEQLAEARSLATIVCVQNNYNLIHRGDDALLEQCRAAGIAFVPFFPLGGFSPLQSGRLDAMAARLNTTAQQVALAWLLARAPNVLVIPGTSTRAHLEENIHAASLVLTASDHAELDALAQ